MRNGRPGMSSWLLACGLLAGGAATIAVADSADLPAVFRRLVPLHERLGKPRPGDWLERHPERGQTYRQYLASQPIRADARRRVLDIQPLGEFSPSQRKIVDLVAGFERIYFQLPVRVLGDLPLSVIPDKARRTHPEWKKPQILSTFVLNDVLKPRLPDDAVAMIAFTASDLWPGEGWNFVFGQASLGDRVGVWSINRFGDPDASEKSFHKTLKRTLRTAVHETGHMFSLPHCTFFQCVMCGSNHLEEADRQPLSLCPICLAKLCYATGAEPRKRFKELIGFAKEHGLADETELWQRSLEALDR